MIRLDLSGSFVASFTAGGVPHVVTAYRGGVVCAAAREMLSLGVDPACEIDVRRDGRRIFGCPKKVEWWAARTVREDNDGPRLRLLCPADAPHSGDLHQRGHSLNAAIDGAPTGSPPVSEAEVRHG